LAGVLLFQSKNSGWHLPPAEAELLLACGRQAGLSCETVGRYGEELSRLKSMQQAQRLAVAGQLAASVAHEIRNPLTAIRSTMQFLLSSSRSWEQKQPLIEEIISEVDRIEQTVSGILSLSRPAHLEATDVDLVAIVEEALLLVQAYGESHGVSFSNEVVTRPLIVMGDPRELRIVFVNILMNACQAIGVPGKVTIRTDLTSRVDSGRTVRGGLIEITDNGSGMSPDTLRSAFEPFVTTKRAGTGLGLPISLDIVTRHAGRIDLASQQGFGTSVSVWIPLRSNT
jgi:signal transduction histidine kinase